MTGAVLGAAIDNWLGLGLAVAVIVFLAVALLFPERF
jgi:hypothetical protein